MTKTIPLSLPKLPSAEQILPYLQQIDKNRWYTNYGPLTHQFLSRLAALFQIERTQVMCGVNGTLLLQICLTALGVPRGSICLMPSWTFVATPLAAVGAGMEPVFIDVDRDTQSVNLKKLEEDLPTLKKLGKIGAVIITAPFGHSVNIQACDEFTARTHIPIIVDAAAGFDSVLHCPEMRVGRTPIMVSLHATKVLSMGEGGVLLSTNEELIAQLENNTQFGFPKGIRNAYSLGSNTKISEYSAAVGLASLDAWPEIKAGWKSITQHYLNALDSAGIQHILSRACVTSTCNIVAPHAADALLTKLNERGIPSRKWWSDGCHRQYIFHHARGAELPHTEFLQRSVLGLPFYIGMEEREVHFVVENVKNLMNQKQKTTLFPNYEWCGDQDKIDNLDLIHANSVEW